MANDLATVFISYTQDSPSHAKAVLDLSNQLRSDGINCVLDQYESSPPEGWPQWMDREIAKAQFVLMVCTEAYHRRVSGKEKPGIGHGIAWEGNLTALETMSDPSTPQAAAFPRAQPKDGPARQSRHRRD